MRRSKILNVKHKDDIIISLEKELSMKEYLMRNYEKNETLINVCTGRIESLKWCLGFDELNEEEKE